MWGRNGDSAPRSHYVSRFAGQERGPRPTYNTNLGENLKDIAWESERLEKFERDFYEEHPDVQKRSLSEAEAWRKENNIQVIGKNSPKPCTTFKEATWPEYVEQELRRAGFAQPTPIQAQAWPLALSGQNVVGVSKTGSGKTLAFALPAILHINAQPTMKPGDGPIVLVLAPTRELAVQISQEFTKFGASSSIKNACLYGGALKRGQMLDLDSSPEVVVATPGRLIDFLEQRILNLKRVTYCVLDEADRMLDMGFRPAIQKILSQVRRDRQILFFSATWPREVQRLADHFLTEGFTRINVGDRDLAVNADIRQIVRVCGGFRDKKEFLVEEVEKVAQASGKVLIFVATKRTAEEVTSHLQDLGYPALATHGDKEQGERDFVLNEFKLGKSPLMVATDVASRGLDVPDISHVINFDLPSQGGIEDYVHRIGRTGRAGRKGTAITFITEQDGRLASDLIDLMKVTQQNIPSELLDIGSGGDPYGGGGDEGFGSGFNDRNGDSQDGTWGPPTGYAAPAASVTSWGETTDSAPAPASSESWNSEQNVNNSTPASWKTPEPSTSQAYRDAPPHVAQSSWASTPTAPASSGVAVDEWGAMDGGMAALSVSPSPAQQRPAAVPSGGNDWSSSSWDSPQTTTRAVADGSGW